MSAGTKIEITSREGCALMPNGLHTSSGSLNNYTIGGKVGQIFTTIGVKSLEVYAVDNGKNMFRFTFAKDENGTDILKILADTAVFTD